MRLAVWLPLLLAIMAMALTASPAAAAVFVDATLGDVKPEQKVTVAHPQPVQLLFQFRTKGSPNMQATKALKPQVVDAVKASGLFSEVSDAPVANGAMLNVVIDNVVDPAEQSAAAGQGFATGATLGIAGSTVREHYTSSLDYVSGPDAPKITRTAIHFLFVQLGLLHAGTPENAVKVDGGLKGGVAVVTRQIVSVPLNALAGDPAFAPAAVASQPAAASPPPAETAPTNATTPASATATATPSESL
ncbi:MAG TPA: hypothetical protein VGH86_02010 [Phenylobacterium sp.]|jgi:hypothetical protein